MCTLSQPLLLFIVSFIVNILMYTGDLLFLLSLLCFPFFPPDIEVVIDWNEDYAKLCP